MIRPVLVSLLAVAAIGVLSGCGIQGGLERPEPMWDSEDALARECSRELRRGERRDPRCAERAQTPAQPQPQ